MSARDNKGTGWSVIADADLRALRDEVARLSVNKTELNEAILELQRALCARDGVPMPSERPVVDKLRDEVARLREVLRPFAEAVEPKVPGDERCVHGYYINEIPAAKYYRARAALEPVR